MKRSLAAALVLASACLGPREDPSAFFLLSPAPAPSEAAPVPVVLGIGPITIPGYLDRPQIVVRLGENEIALAGSDRWAEPLEENITRTLSENLSLLLPGSSFIEYPWFESSAPDYGVALEIRRFEADASGDVVLDASWRLSERGRAVVDERATRIQEIASGQGRAAAVATLSRALAELSVEIAAGVRRARGGSGGELRR